MFNINYGYGTGKKTYETLKGAKIACQAHFKKSNDQWLDVVEIKKVIRKCGVYAYLSTDVIHHTIFRK